MAEFFEPQAEQPGDRVWRKQPEHFPSPRAPIDQEARAQQQEIEYYQWWLNTGRLDSFMQRLGDFGRSPEMTWVLIVLQLIWLLSFTL